MNVERLNQSVNARSYDSPTRRAQAEKTRRQIADAARDLFVERGWSGTRVRDVAAAAGVSEPTVYAVYGNKAGLATALLDSLTAAVDLPRHMSEIKAAEGDPPRQIAALVAIDRQLFEHGADAITVIREAGKSNPDLAPVYAARPPAGRRGSPAGVRLLAVAGVARRRWPGGRAGHGRRAAQRRRLPRARPGPRMVAGPCRGVVGRHARAPAAARPAARCSCLRPSASCLARGSH